MGLSVAVEITRVGGIFRGKFASVQLPNEHNCHHANHNERFHHIKVTKCTLTHLRTQKERERERKRDEGREMGNSERGKRGERGVKGKKEGGRRGEK